MAHLPTLRHRIAEYEAVSERYWFPLYESKGRVDTQHSLYEEVAGTYCVEEYLKKINLEYMKEIWELPSPPKVVKLDSKQIKRVEKILEMLQGNVDKK